jgi:hypothetical protein
MDEKKITPAVALTEQQAEQLIARVSDVAAKVGRLVEAAQLRAQGPGPLAELARVAAQRDVALAANVAAERLYLRGGFMVMALAVRLDGCHQKERSLPGGLTIGDLAVHLEQAARPGSFIGPVQEFHHHGR